MRALRWIIPILAMLGFIGQVASAASAEEEVVPPDSIRARDTLLPFKKQLMGALTQALEGGSLEALRVCNLQAPEIASRASSDEIALGRTSHRLRNPANAPQEWMKPLLNAYVGTGPGAAPRWVELPKGRFGYVEPIYVATPCLTCHGDALAPELSAALAEIYPEDRATGFELDDFRGMFWLVMEPGAREPQGSAQPSP